MKQRFFVTGTDTDAGKTLVSSALLHLATASGKGTIGLKPVAAGCELIEGELRNADALALMAESSIELSYSQVNPIALEPPIAPHIAAVDAGVRISADRLQAYINGALMRKYDFALVEGAGGWRVPLNDRESLATLAQLLQFPVIVVVGMKLGCINHALLTVEAIRRDGLQIAGWVANTIDPEMSEFDRNLAWLTQVMPAPCLGVIPHLSEPLASEAAAHLDITLLD
ncbi:dethiobiotin synthase [Marinobacterium sp. LSUCC0821]|jgi:dethiobiotin synthetase|uniref:dethiobiotin synthase n=1 Tax=Marinobacterium sp. LSUCC0821 TaxID=2668067 RepID=UPI00145111E7|nr:dethiobiotin synthase [Marinobacterium sp. LSUCC0821]QJD71346.1 dethiobiotin synthase [Marinobacterium sp. LSUCC0821]